MLANPYMLHNCALGESMEKGNDRAAKAAAKQAGEAQVRQAKAAKAAAARSADAAAEAAKMLAAQADAARLADIAYNENAARLEAARIAAALVVQRAAAARAAALVVANQRAADELQKQQVAEQNRLNVAEDVKNANIAKSQANSAGKKTAQEVKAMLQKYVNARKRYEEEDRAGFARYTRRSEQDSALYAATWADITKYHAAHVTSNATAPGHLDKEVQAEADLKNLVALLRAAGAPPPLARATAPAKATYAQVAAGASKAERTAQAQFRMHNATRNSGVHAGYPGTAADGCWALDVYGADAGADAGADGLGGYLYGADAGAHVYGLGALMYGAGADDAALGASMYDVGAYGADDEDADCADCADGAYDLGAYGAGDVGADAADLGAYGAGAYGAGADSALGGRGENPYTV